MIPERYYRLWADVDLDSIRSNILLLKSQLSPGTKTCAVVKADGYGHGAVKVAQNIEDIVDFYAVATIDEAMELRTEHVKKPILVLGYVHPTLVKTAILHDIRLTVYDAEDAKEISRIAEETGKQAVIHIKVDTGMGRIGFSPDETSADIVKTIHELPGLVMEGLYTHFANADTSDPANALHQLELFNEFADALAERGIRIPVKHCSNSAASTLLRSADMDMVRLGISMYGLYPSEDVHQLALKPALSLKSHVIMVKTVPEGTAVGYGSTWKAARESRIATIPAGYADGYFRSLSNKGYVLIRGEAFPVIGRVCMDQLMADVTDSMSVQKGDEAVLIGDSGNCRITTEEIAQLAGTFNYEFVCGLGRRVPRKYYRDGKYVGVKDIFEYPMID